MLKLTSTTQNEKSFHNSFGKLLAGLNIFFALFIISLSVSIKEAKAQIPPPPYVPCGSTRSPEFHSLRPYQKSPCDEGVSETALFCGNSLILSDEVSRVQTISPSSASNCSPTGNGKYKCKFTVNKTTNIAIDLSDAEFPILGNTELVKNSQSQEDLENPEKVNEYVSWYLSGTPYVPEYPPTDPGAIEGIDEIINFSGPLKKLLPQSFIFEAQIGSVEKRGKERHNQIVVCAQESVLGLFGKTTPHECYKGDGSRAISDVYRLDDWDGSLSFWNTVTNTLVGLFTSLFPNVPKEIIRESIGDHWNERVPPLEWDERFKDDSRLYLKAYQEWRGKTCVLLPFLNTPICIDNPFVKNKYSELFAYVPLSSTEDRKGQVSLDSSNVSPASPDIELKNVNLDVEPAELFFSHTQEVAELAQSLQQTYLPAEGVEETGAPLSVSPTQFCDIANVRSNPGDDLFAGEIEGTLSYTAEFSCNMDGSDAGKTCNKNVSVGLEVQTETPKADEIWSRLVAGPAGIFKRIFPKIGVGSAIEALLDMPGSTNVVYSADNLVSVGSPTSGRSDPELYFPHIGGVSEYFLKGIQTALRPKGYGEQIISGSAGTIPTSDDINCNQNAPEANVSQLLTKDAMYQLALNWVSGQSGNHVLECYNDVVAKAQAGGVNVALAFWVWLHESNASNYSVSDLDFGVISVSAQDFIAQIGAFLSTAQGYSSTPASCPPGTTPMQAFAYVYSSGQCDPNAPVAGTNQTAQGFYNELVNQLGWITSCPLPTGPTDTSCP